jgi:hypothetical protein
MQFITLPASKISCSLWQPIKLRAGAGLDARITLRRSGQLIADSRDNQVT